MRTIAFIGAVLLIVIAVFQGYFEKQTWFEIQSVQIEGDLKYSDKVSLAAFYDGLKGQSLLSFSQQELVQLSVAPPWVSSASIRRLWPNGLLIVVKEHEPLAIWRERQIITSSRDIIAPQKMPLLPLPLLFGPEGSDKVVLEQFGLVSQVLSSTDLRIKKLQLEARGAWSIEFDNSLAVRLGREEVLERLQRFIAVYISDLSGRIAEINYVDARYPHGVAVNWKTDV